MAQIEAALVREQGVVFAVVVVKNHVVTSEQQSSEMISVCARALQCQNIVLMGESNRRLRGNRSDVVRFVANLDPRRLPWRKWTI
ncbi:hypothetical protein JI664_22665 [Rhodobacter sp. NTK016B]|uniref:hypothetical protein n=1 Tax=Rhodobacter sp. NTK016B TaxID=2759676 RepID=UPI001A8D8ACF|nr:hypothetical protein [Rhodobacter sp. NTK016B]MBN8294791.1 hypothetical protein [Rhodobacter sp. NTK016B]